MAKIKRGNYVFITYKGDHDSYHCHIFRDKKEIAKWDLERKRAMEGRVSGRQKRILEALQREGKV